MPISRTKSASDHSRDNREAAADDLVRADVERIASLMDDRFRVPGTSLRFGLDSLIGLIPGIGETVTAGISTYLMALAWQAGAPFLLIVRMALNVVLDTVLGAIPLVGDLFDFAWKANRKNAQLLANHMERKQSRR